MYLASKEARAWAVAGNGPVVIEAITNRLEPHSTAGDDPLRYRTKEDIEAWWKKEPLVRMRNFLTEKHFGIQRKRKLILLNLMQVLMPTLRKPTMLKNKKFLASLKIHLKCQAKQWQNKLQNLKARANKNGSKNLYCSNYRSA